MSSAISANWTSVNAACQPLVDQLVADAQALQLEVRTLSNGTRIIDAGINCVGGLGRSLNWRNLHGWTGYSNTGYQ